VPKGIYFTSVISSFFFSMPNLRSLNGSPTKLGQHIFIIWLLFEKYGPNSPRHLPPQAGGTLFRTDFELWPNLTLQRSTTSTIRKNPANLHGLPNMPQIMWTLVQKRMRTVGEFLHTPKFSYWETLLVCQPYHMDVI